MTPIPPLEYFPIIFFFHFLLGRTILMSTHHLDEAETVADRLILIHQGKLVCTGSPMWLKKQYGSGYQLTVAKALPTLQVV